MHADSPSTQPSDDGIAAAPAASTPSAPSAAPAASTVEPVQPPKAAQPRNPLHGLTLQAIVEALHQHYGWSELAREVPIRCFQSDPSVASSLKFLRKTPWAREKVESLYLFMLREQRRNGQR